MIIPAGTRLVWSTTNPKELLVEAVTPSVTTYRRLCWYFLPEATTLDAVLPVPTDISPSKDMTGALAAYLAAAIYRARARLTRPETHFRTIVVEEPKWCAGASGLRAFSVILEELRLKGFQLQYSNTELILTALR